MGDPIRIALVGKKKAGKTFIAQYVKVHYKFKKWALADGVRRIFRTLNDFHQWQRIHWMVERDVYDFMYKIDNDIWVKFMERRLRYSDANVIIDDVRYVNEVQYLKNLGFIIVRITAPETRRQVGIAKQLGKNYSAGSVILNEYFNVDNTETYQVDYTIHNDNKDNARLAVDKLLLRYNAERRKLRRDIPRIEELKNLTQSQ